MNTFYLRLYLSFFSLLQVMKPTSHRMKRVCRDCSTTSQRRRGIQLLNCAVNGHVNCLKSTVNAGANVNINISSDDFCPNTQSTRDSRLSYTPLTCAAEFGHVECIKLLVESGAAVNMPNTEGDTPLMIAAEKGHMACVNILLGAGADVNIANNYGYEALWDAALNGHSNCTKELIQAGADVKGTDGIEPIMAAAFNGEPECMEALVKAGADVNTWSTCIKNVKFNKASIAVPNKYRIYVERIGLNITDVNPNDKSGTSPLIDCARFGNDKCVEFLIKAGADVNQSRNNGKDTALVYAVKASEKCVDLLVTAGADVNVGSTDNDNTPLILAAHENVESVKLLLRAGAEINRENQSFNNGLRDLFFLHRHPDRTMVLLLHAAGETIDGNNLIWYNFDALIPERVEIPDYLSNKNQKLSLKHQCRETIRKRLLEVDRHTHLFGRVTKLGLPKLLAKYLVYNMSLDDTDSVSTNLNRNV